MLNAFSKDKTPFYQRGSDYHYRALKLNYRDYSFYQDIVNLSFPTDMMGFARKVNDFMRGNQNYFYAIKVCPQDKAKLSRAYGNDVYLNDLCVPVSLFRHLGRGLFPEAFGREDRTRQNAKSPSILKQTTSFAWREWTKYMALMRQLAEDDFTLIFVSQGKESEPPHNMSIPDSQRLQQHFENKKLPSQHYVYAVKALADQATQDGVLNDLTLRTKTMIEDSLPTLEKLEDILSALLKLEEQDIETRSQAKLNEAMEAYRQEYETKLQSAEAKHTQQLVEMHETINRLQDMVDGIYKQNELLLEAQQNQAGKYEDNLMSILGKLKNEL